MYSSRSSGNKHLGEEAMRLIRDMILHGDLLPGQRLVEERLARRIGTSRTPVREALHRMEREGLVERRPTGGYLLRPLTAKEVEEAEGVRAALEAYAAELAAKRITPQHLTAMEENLIAFDLALEQGDNEALLRLNAAFHALLYQAADSVLLIRLLGETAEVVERISRALISTMGAGTWSSADHRGMFQALGKGDSLLAGRLVREHVERGGRWIISQMEKEGLEL